ncbi:MAG: hypothetical protein JNJ49_03390 [Bdellovibrionaceae bacterium]|nr:hypothetical protein [Pseudobdellovibrionaceae bacterium]
MKIDPFTDLMEEARIEAYDYFDQNIRKLPRGANGKIKIVGAAVDDNDVDAFRHAYVSGVFTQKFGEKTANFFGLLNEFDLFGKVSQSNSPGSTNMDLWNNRVGRKYGTRTRGRKTLLKLIHQALKRGELIIDPKDSRKFSGVKIVPKRIAKPIIALEKSKTGRNETYFDLLNKIVLTREEFIALIRAGEYRGYSVKLIRGIETPVSKRDGRRINNIG